MTKYIFVTGGVVSGLGKGISAASLGRLLKARGYKVTSQKLDPYINVDPGTMSPLQHGEVFVTEDGLEADLDLGHYERFIDENLHTYSNLTTGKVYWNVINKERDGKYLGQTVQVIPHVTNEIKSFIHQAGKHANADFVITEIGGTTGDIESLPFLESIRQIQLEVGRQNCLFIHVTYIPSLEGSKEYKSKPTQHSVKELRSYGINPDIIITRCNEKIPASVLNKISLFCNVDQESVIENITLDSLYEVPLMLEEQHLADIVCKKMDCQIRKPDLSEWKAMVDRIKHPKQTVHIGLVGKYVELHDAYLSVSEALYHAGFANSASVKIHWIDSEGLTQDNLGEKLKGIDGIILPGGFGDRGIEGMIQTAIYCYDRWAMNSYFLRFAYTYKDRYSATVTGRVDGSSKFGENNKYAFFPSAGLAWNISQEDFMQDQSNEMRKGGTMRLGAYPCQLKQGTKLYALYNQDLIQERHRHRYEFNNFYRDEFENHGMMIAGTSPDQQLVEAIEAKDHPFFVGVQYHPEFKSRPNRPHPIFEGFIQASLQNQD